MCYAILESDGASGALPHGQEDAEDGLTMAGATLTRMIQPPESTIQEIHELELDRWGRNQNHLIPPHRHFPHDYICA
jgi:hypothetical protein